jgi:hypothetical protein
VRRWLIAVAALGLGAVLLSLVLDEGEVAHLESRDASGQVSDVDVWIVEIDGVLYLRANNRDADWVSRVLAGSEIELRREAGTSSVRATVQADPLFRQRVDRAMALKYGIAENLWDWVVNPDETLVLRLDALPRPSQ